MKKSEVLGKIFEILWTETDYNEEDLKELTEKILEGVESKIKLYWEPECQN